ncbi:MAG: septation protein SepH [Actinomycetota bacterium]
MKRLRVIGSSEDNDELVLSNKPKGRVGSHIVAIDKRLLDVLQNAMYARRGEGRSERPPQRAEPASAIPPREIQRHLRAGYTATHVARLAGVSEEYVEQFLTPVLYERRGVIADAQSLYLEKQRLGRSHLPLGEAVLANLALRRVRFDEDTLADAWSASRQEGQPWTIGLAFPFRGRTRTARWRFDQRARTLEPANKLAADVGWISNGKGAHAPLVAVGAAQPGATTRRKTVRRKKAGGKKTARRKPAARKAGKRSPARKKSVKRKPVAREAAKRKPAKRKPAKRKPAARRRTR